LFYHQIMSSFKPKIGFALGGGAARGWAHIGVINSLLKYGIKPDVVAGTSIGSLVGGAYVSGHLQQLESWVKTISRRDIVALLDVDLSSGGFIQGDRLMNFFASYIGDYQIEDLETPFGVTATDLNRGTEVWIRSGSMLKGIRSSIALPGLFSPAYYMDRWLVDGGLVNPVPVSVCRAMGADIVIAVNLSSRMIDKTVQAQLTEEDFKVHTDLTYTENNLVDRISRNTREWLGDFKKRIMGENDHHPGLFDVLTNTINIMQERITRSRMAGDPPDIIISPHVAHIGLMEFERASEGIVKGEEAVEHVKHLIDRII